MYETFLYQAGTWEPIEDPLTTGWMPEAEVTESVIQERWASLGYSRVEDRFGNPLPFEPDVTPVAVRRRTSEGAPHFAIVDVRLCKPAIRVCVADAPSLFSLLGDLSGWIGVQQAERFQRGIMEIMGHIGHVMLKSFDGSSLLLVR